MNLDAFFEKFDSLTDTDAHIPGIRKVILSSLLFDSITSPDALEQAEYLRQIHKKVKRERFGEKAVSDFGIAVADTDLPPVFDSIAPGNFERLGNIATIEKGLTPIQKAEPGKYPLVVTAEERGSCSSYDFEGAAVLIPMVSSTGHGHASLKRIHYQDGQFAAGNILTVVQPLCPDHLHARFIYEYLSIFKDELLVSRMVGTANVSLTINKLKEVPVPLVSSQALKRLNELMALCDTLEAQQKEREAKRTLLAKASLAAFAEAPSPTSLELLFHPSFAIDSADLRKSILTLAVQGKLVPQEPGDEDAITLLENVLEHRCQNFSNADELFPLPESWVWASFADVAEIASNLVDPKRFPESIHLAPDNIEKATGRLLQCRTVAEDEVKSSNHQFSAGQIVYSKIRPNLSKVVIVDFNGLCSADMYPINARIESGYLLRYMLSESFLAQAVKADTRIAMPKINQSELRLIRVSVPPLAEQKRIVAKVDELMGLVDRLEAKIVASRETAARLLEAMVAELSGKAAA